MICLYSCIVYIMPESPKAPSSRSLTITSLRRPPQGLNIFYTLRKKDIIVFYRFITMLYSIYCVQVCGNYAPPETLFRGSTIAPSTIAKLVGNSNKTNMLWFSRCSGSFRRSHEIRVHFLPNISLSYLEPIECT